MYTLGMGQYTMLEVSTACDDTECHWPVVIFNFAVVCIWIMGTPRQREVSHGASEEA